MSNENYDFKGNLLTSSRQLAKQYKAVVNWHAVDDAIPINSKEKLHLDTLTLLT